MGASVGPIGAVLGGLIGVIVGATAGCAAGKVLGHQIDEAVLDKYDCRDCGYHFGRTGAD